MKTKVNIKPKKFGIGSLGLTGILLIIFAILGGIIGGITGIFVGILMVLVLWVLIFVALIPFVGIFWFVTLFNMAMNYIYSIAPQMSGLVAQDALPRIGLFWLYVIIGSIVCIFMSALVVFFIIVGIVSVASWISDR